MSGTKEAVPPLATTRHHKEKFCLLFLICACPIVSSKGKQEKRRGRPKRFDGKVAWTRLLADQWETEEYDEHTRLSTAILWSPTLKRTARVVVVEEMRGGVSVRHAILCSSDTTLGSATIFEYYTKRFQIEFLFRDAKQYTGLTHCQARSENKLHFHFNASLASVSVATIAHFFDASGHATSPYSLADVGMAYCNEFFYSLLFFKVRY